MLLEASRDLLDQLTEDQLKVIVCNWCKDYFAKDISSYITSELNLTPDLVMVTIVDNAYLLIAALPGNYESVLSLMKDPDNQAVYQAHIKMGLYTEVIVAERTSRERIYDNIKYLEI